MFRHAQRRRDELVASRWAYGRAWGNLDQLLMAPLQRAFSFPQMRDAARLIAENLHFNMAGCWHEALNIHLAIAKRCTCFRLAAVVRLFKVLKTPDNAHAATTTTCQGFYDDRGI